MSEKKQSNNLASYLAIILVCLFTTSFVIAQDSSAQQIGVAGRIDGAASVIHGGNPQNSPLKDNDPVYVRDEILTMERSKTWLALRSQNTDPEGSDASLGEISSFKPVFYARSGATSSFSGEVVAGTVRLIKRLLPTAPPSTYAVTTPSALVQVIATEVPADFVVEVINDQQSVITVLGGQVAVKNVDPGFTLTRVLTSCQQVVVERGQEPSEIIGVSSDNLRSLVERTTIPGTLPEQVPICEACLPEIPPVVESIQPTIVMEPATVIAPPTIVTEPATVITPPEIVQVIPVPVDPVPDGGGDEAVDEDDDANDGGGDEAVDEDDDANDGGGDEAADQDDNANDGGGDEAVDQDDNANDGGGDEAVDEDDNANDGGGDEAVDQDDNANDGGGDEAADEDDNANDGGGDEAVFGGDPGGGGIPGPVPFAASSHQNSASVVSNIDGASTPFHLRMHPSSTAGALLQRHRGALSTLRGHHNRSTHGLRRHHGALRALRGHHNRSTHGLRQHRGASRALRGHHNRSTHGLRRHGQYRHRARVLSSSRTSHGSNHFRGRRSHR